jgi:SnoaL-like domain
MTTRATAATISGDKRFRDHIARFNAGVDSGDFGPMIAAFSDDAVFTFEGRSLGPLRGRAEIAAGYRDYPTTDWIEVLSTTEPDESTVVARFRWVRAGDAGTITMQHRGEVLTAITVTFDGTSGPEVHP